MATNTAKENTLEISRFIPAPQSRVFAAWTRPEEIVKWFGPEQVTCLSAKMELQIGGSFHFRMKSDAAGETDFRGVYLEVKPPARLVYTWGWKNHPVMGTGETLVTVDFLERDGGTEIRLRHEGFTNVDLRDRHNHGWSGCFDKLGKFCNAGSSTGGSDREIVITREFNAPRELVWKAMTNPKHVVNWWGPRGFSTTIEQMDVRPGGTWKHVMRGSDGANYPNHSVFKEVVKPERIVYLHGGKREGGPGASFEATWTFEALAADKTRVTMRGVFPSAADRDFVVKEFGAIEGGKQTLERLGEYLPKMGRPPGRRPLPVIEKIQNRITS